MIPPPVILMEDRDLKKLLLETCPVRPGQEARAWSALRDRLYAQPAPSGIAWLFQPMWRRVVLTALAIGFVSGAGGMFLLNQARALATAESQAPGVYATSFYSKSAKAQVVWLNGMEPASDRPTYLDTTGVIADKSEAPTPPAGDPNSL
jgi:hypothetical protein